MGKKLIFVIIALLLLSVSAAAVFADDYCWIDEYGCWVEGEDGGKMYLMFWSEASRRFFMGDSTEPYKDVVDYCEDCGGRLKMFPPAEEPAAAPGLTIKFKVGKIDFPNGLAILKGIVALTDMSEIKDETAIIGTYSQDLGALEIPDTGTYIPMLKVKNFDKLESIYSGYTVMDGYGAINAGQFTRVKFVEGVLSDLAFSYLELNPGHYYLTTPAEYAAKMSDFSTTPVYGDLEDGGKDEYGIEYVIGVWGPDKTSEIFAPID